jgi:hypothetical protein
VRLLIECTPTGSAAKSDKENKAEEEAVEGSDDEHPEIRYEKFSLPRFLFFFFFVVDCTRTSYN